MRSYVVVPAGTVVQIVDASRPQHAVGKARRQHGEALTFDAPAVFPLTAQQGERSTGPVVHRDQLAFDAA